MMLYAELKTANEIIGRAEEIAARPEARNLENLRRLEVRNSAIAIQETPKARLAKALNKILRLSGADYFWWFALNTYSRN